VCSHKERVSGQHCLALSTRQFIFLSILRLFHWAWTLLTATCADSPIPEISPEAFYVESDI